MFLKVLKHLLYEKIDNEMYPRKCEKSARLENVKTNEKAVGYLTFSWTQCCMSKPEKRSCSVNRSSFVSEENQGTKI